MINPLENPPWDELKGKPITIEEVRRKMVSDYSPQDKYFEYNANEPKSRQFHIERIAFLAANGWEDEPISIYFNSKGIYPIQDGSHRLAAAIVRKNEWIAANWTGDIALLRKVTYD